MVTKLLEKAFVEASKLPEREQSILATWILEELASEATLGKGLRRFP